MQCPICKNIKTEEFFIGRDLLHNQESNFKLYRCKTCNLVLLESALNEKELEKYYPKDYISFPKAIQNEKNIIRKFDRQFGVNKRVNRVLQKTKQTGKILDIGCATGIFLNEMKKKGWDSYGIEPSTHAADYARHTYGLEIYNGMLEKDIFPESFFDVITMWDVLEHVPDPWDIVANVWKLLKPNGLFVISMPNTLAWEQQFFGKYWAGWDIPRHTYIFNNENIYNLLESNNFTVSEISSFTGRHGVFVLSVKFWLNFINAPKFIKNTTLFLARSIIARIISYPFYMVADRKNRSSIMTVFSRKLNL